MGRQGSKQCEFNSMKQNGKIYNNFLGFILLYKGWDGKGTKTRWYSEAYVDLGLVDWSTKYIKFLNMTPLP